MYTKFPSLISYKTNYLRAILAGSAVGLFFSFLIYLFFPPIQVESGINERIERAKNATCEVKDNHGSIGTGILLETGFVLTASHVVDDNGDGRLEDWERGTTVLFYNEAGVSSVHSASVVYLSNRDFLDFAILEVENAPKSDVKLQMSYPKIGDELFTIGCTRGMNPHLSHGHESMRSGRYPLYARASVPVYSGNSGGGLFNSDQEVVGIVSMVGVDRLTTYVDIPVPTDHGVMIVTTAADYVVFMSSWTEYTRSQFMFLELKSLGLEFTVVNPPVETDWGTINIYLSMTAQIILVLVISGVLYRYLR